MFGIHDPYSKNKHVFHGSCHIFFVAWDMFLLMISLVGVTWHTATFLVAVSRWRSNMANRADFKSWMSNPGTMRRTVTWWVHDLGFQTALRTNWIWTFLRRGGLTLFLAGFWDLQITSDYEILADSYGSKDSWNFIWSNYSDLTRVLRPPQKVACWKGPMGPLIMLGRCWIHVLMEAGRYLQGWNSYIVYVLLSTRNDSQCHCDMFQMGGSTSTDSTTN